MVNADTNWLSSMDATILDNYIPILQDNVFLTNPLLDNLKGNKGLASSVMVEGKKLIVPLMVGKNAGATSYDGYDQINLAPSAGIVDGEIDYSFYTVPIVISREEEKRTSGNKTQMVSLLKGRMTQAEQGLYERLTTDLYSDGTGNGGKNLTGFLAMIPTAASSSAGTYMNINGSTGGVTAWQHKYETQAVASVLTGMENLYRACKDGEDKTNVIVTSDLGESVYAAKLGTSSGTGIGYSVAYTDNKNLDFGAVSYSFKGIPILTDKSHPEVSTTLPIYHFLNTKYLGFIFANWEVEAFTKAQNQKAKYAFINVDCQLFTNNRRRQGKLVTS